ncbi:MAG: spore photoproduct lyase, partial [Pseudohongiellaceae bacterium]
MFAAIYVEKEIKQHPRTLEILNRFSDLPVIDCERYGEVFNRNA